MIEKITRRIRCEIIAKTREKQFYVKLYKSFWHYQFSNKSKNIGTEINYYTANPNPGAGIGHQLANWIAGYWFARQFCLKFAHSSFSSEKWEQFLGFGVDEIKVTELLQKGYKKVRLPLFNEFNLNEVELAKNIIKSYTDQRVIFVAEQDQFYQDQFGVIDDLKRKFYSANARKNDQLIYSRDYFNIAIHVRRGDITIGQLNQNPNLLMRWQDNNYFERVLTSIVENLVTDKPLAIYIFSQGVKEDFQEFEKFSNIHFCLEMGAQDSFLHFVYADLLITSKSSFSYKPALLSNGIKVCPKNFWHGYPDTKDWILVDDNGVFNLEQLNL
jgi:hypothetical protein